MSIRKKVANLWAPLLQSKGNSTTQPMSQKAVSDELSQLKSDLDNKINTSDSLTYEEIMANNIDLTGKVAKAESVKDIGGRIITGRGVIPETSSTGSQTVHVNFGVTLPNKPNVVLISWADSQSNVQDYIASLMTNINSYTTTGFDIIVHRKSTYGKWRYCWIAIY